MIHSNNVNNGKLNYNDGYQMECHTSYENEEDYSYNSNIYHRRGMYWKRYYDLFESDYFNGNGNKDKYKMYVSIIPSW